MASVDRANLQSYDDVESFIYGTHRKNYLVLYNHDVDKLHVFKPGIDRTGGLTAAVRQDHEKQFFRSLNGAALAVDQADYLEYLGNARTVETAKKICTRFNIPGAPED